jgi:hypothetical protein
MTSTQTNILWEDWTVRDAVTQLRTWGGDRVYDLSPGSPPLLIGSSADCAIQVQDPTRRASREHAQLRYAERDWIVSDRSKNGTYMDGQRLPRFALIPGVELGVGGGVTLIAESPRVIQLRRTLSRMIGWSAERAVEVDLALRAIRNAARWRLVLALSGEDLVPLAEELHRWTAPAGRPFVLLNLRQHTTKSTRTPMKCADSGQEALGQAAGGGTICALAKWLPRDWRKLTQAINRPGRQTMLIVCAESAQQAATFSPWTIEIPPLSARQHELDQIIGEYAVDAAQFLGMDEDWLKTEDRNWIRDRLHTLGEIQKGTLRLAATQQAGSMSAGAVRLGISHTSMLRWFQARKFFGD